MDTICGYNLNGRLALDLGLTSGGVGSYYLRGWGPIRGAGVSPLTLIKHMSINNIHCVTVINNAYGHDS